MNTDPSFTMQAPEEGQRLDVWLKRKIPHWSRGGIRVAIEGGHVRVDGHAVHRGRILHAGEVVHVLDVPDPEAPPVRPAPALPLSILQEDDFLVVLDKPAGLAVHPLRPGGEPTLAAALIAQYPDLCGLSKDTLRPGLPDSLETECSGLVLAAKTAGAYSSLRGQLQRHEVLRTYLALVQGTVSHSGRLSCPIVQDPARRGRMKALAPGRSWVGEKAMRAVTDIVPLASAGAFTLIQTTLRSNVPHQVRCHLAASGHPLAGDTEYGGAELSGRMGFLLHRSRMELLHPGTGMPLVLRCGLPADGLRILQELGIRFFESPQSPR
jgi:23S rRNA pseudouridine1911/1915/1917 synthase